MVTLDLVIRTDKEEVEAAEVLVDGTIAGHNYRFLLDTGAARSTVLFDTYTSTYISTERHRSSGVFARSAYDLITVPAIEVGPISRKPFTLIRAHENSPEKRNLIGMDLLKDYCCHFLFDENRLVVDAEDEFSVDGTLHKLFLDSRSHPYVEVWFGSLKANAVWDTGAGITVVNTSFVASHPLFFNKLVTQ